MQPIRRSLDELQAALERLMARHGDGVWSEYAVKLKIWRDPDGLYLLKGGGAKVWKLFPRIRKAWRLWAGDPEDWARGKGR